MRRAVITGMGAVCAGASGIDELEALCAEGRLGIKKCTVFETEGLITDKFGQADTDPDDRTRGLIRRAGEQMLENAGIDSEYIASLGKSCRMFYGTLMSDSPAYLKNSYARAEGRDENVLCEMNTFAGYAAQLFGVKGALDISSAACASGTTAVGMAYEFISAGLCDAAVAGGADALSEMSAYGFNSLKSLSSDICTPYDENRDGINIGECGAFFFIEELEHAKARNAGILCEIAGFAAGNDAYHITSPEPEGREAVCTMKAALEDAGISAGDIDYINGHGTGTAINDLMEKRAAESLLFGCAKRPYISSTKALIGHCMGSSGAIELASVIMSMKTGRPIMMPRLESPIDGCEMFTAPESINIRYAMSNSFAFAGSSASLIVKAWEGEL